MGVDSLGSARPVTLQSRILPFLITVRTLWFLHLVLLLHFLIHILNEIESVLLFATLVFNCVVVQTCRSSFGTELCMVFWFGLLEFEVNSLFLWVIYKLVWVIWNFWLGEEVSYLLVVLWNSTVGFRRRMNLLWWLDHEWLVKVIIQTVVLVDRNSKFVWHWCVDFLEDSMFLQCKALFTNDISWWYPTWLHGVNPRCMLTINTGPLTRLQLPYISSISHRISLYPFPGLFQHIKSQPKSSSSLTKDLSIPRASISRNGTLLNTSLLVMTASDSGNCGAGSANTH